MLNDRAFTDLLRVSFTTTTNLYCYCYLSSLIPLIISQKTELVLLTINLSAFLYVSGCVVLYSFPLFKLTKKHFKKFLQVVFCSCPHSIVAIIDIKNLKFMQLLLSYLQDDPTVMSSFKQLLRNVHENRLQDDEIVQGNPKTG